MAESYDVIVVGGGLNGLACAAYLARAGRTVLVLERRYVLGGAAVTEELYPGFKYTVCSSSTRTSPRPRRPSSRFRRPRPTIWGWPGWSI